MDSLIIDNLNNIVSEQTQRSVPYEEYFGEMELSQEEIEERIEEAESLEDVMLSFFMLVGITTTYEILQNSLYGDYLLWLSESGDVDDYLSEYADKTTEAIVLATLNSQGNSWFTSLDRAMFIAENEANSTSNYRQWRNAVLSGKKRKTWKTLRDKKVRKSHKEVDRETIAIGEPFIVDGGILMFPKDMSLGVDANEIVNCRCVCNYF